jgi:hypothetical protein
VIELDLATGCPCAGFGEQRTVHLSLASPQRYAGQMTLD